MKVAEVRKFALDNEGEWMITPDSEEILARNLDSEVICKISELTTDELEVYMTFIDGATGKEGFLGIAEGGYAVMLLDEFGIEVAADHSGSIKK